MFKVRLMQMQEESPNRYLCLRVPHVLSDFELRRVRHHFARVIEKAFYAPKLEQPEEVPKRTRITWEQHPADQRAYLVFRRRPYSSTGRAPEVRIIQNMLNHVSEFVRIREKHYQGDVSDGHGRFA